MKKKIALIQMQAVLADVETNYRHAEELMEQAMEGNPDILVLPETWWKADGNVLVFFRKKTPCECRRRFGSCSLWE